MLEGPAPALKHPHARALWTDTKAFYERRGHQLAWTAGRKDRPSDLATEAIAELQRTVDHALDPQRYAVDALAQQREALSQGGDDDERKLALARFDVHLTMSVLAAGRDVALGRTSPAALDRRWKSQRTAPPFVDLLTQATEKRNIDGWLERLQPRHPDYARLQKAWTALSARAGTEWPDVPRVTLKPGARRKAVEALRARLIAGGELPADAAGDPHHYAGPIVDAVKVFQAHHGMQATGVVDPHTVAAMNVPLAQRLRQIALNLERWRWLPDDLGSRHLRVNIPAYYLDAYEDGRLVLEIRAVVGRKGDETPVFSDAMSHVVFSPYWNIPESIATGETLPALAEDEEYLERNNIEVVRVSGNQVEVLDPDDVDWSDEEAVKDVALRQRPGADNALGLVKFMFPNPFNVYIHDTPADDLFSRRGRSFSHGCIRIEDPVGFARYVLRDQPEWTAEAIDAAMHAGEEKHVRLTGEIPVHIVYFTAWADEEGGLHFRDDVYGFDGRQSLAAPTAAVGRTREAV